MQIRGRGRKDPEPRAEIDVRGRHALQLVWYTLARVAALGLHELCTRGTAQCIYVLASQSQKPASPAPESCVCENLTTLYLQYL